MVEVLSVGRWHGLDRHWTDGSGPRGSRRRTGSSGSWSAARWRTGTRRSGWPSPSWSRSASAADGADGQIGPNADRGRGAVGADRSAALVCHHRERDRALRTPRPGHLVDDDGRAARRIQPGSARRRPAVGLERGDAPRPVLGRERDRRVAQRAEDAARRGAGERFRSGSSGRVGWQSPRRSARSASSSSTTGCSGSSTGSSCSPCRSSSAVRSAWSAEAWTAQWKWCRGSSAWSPPRRGSRAARPGPTCPRLRSARSGSRSATAHSFVINFLGRREYLRVTISRQMFAPYGRLVILHVTIIIGAMVSLFLGTPIGAIVVLVILKTALDLTLHLREHGSMGTRRGLSTAPSRGQLPAARAGDGARLGSSPASASSRAATADPPPSSRARSNGPIGWAAPRRRARSTSASVATPSSRARKASSTSGRRIRSRISSGSRAGGRRTQAGRPGGASRRGSDGIPRRSCGPAPRRRCAAPGAATAGADPAGRGPPRSRSRRRTSRRSRSGPSARTGPAGTRRRASRRRSRRRWQRQSRADAARAA